jgi:hypothetical protein
LRIDLDRILKVLAVLGAVASFLWGVFVWQTQSQREASSQRIEAMRPFLERQLELYTETSRVAAILATAEDPKTMETARARFWQLYWGELTLVENAEVEAAMVALGTALSNNERNDIQHASLNLAKAFRASLDRSWGVNVWTNPDQVPASTPKPQK